MAKGKAKKRFATFRFCSVCDVKITADGETQALAVKKVEEKMKKHVRGHVAPSSKKKNR